MLLADAPPPSKLPGVLNAAGLFSDELRLYSNRTIDVPSLFISGTSDWGVYQRAGRLEAMRDQICTDMRGVHLLEGAGHWVQQEQPEAVSRLMLEFLQGQKG